MVKWFRVCIAFFLALICVSSFVSVSTVSPAWAVAAWTQVGSDIDGEGAGNFSGSSVSFSSNGSRVAIGAQYNNGAGGYQGHVRVYDLTSDEWVQVGADIDGEGAYDYSGSSVSLSADGSRVAIGAEYNDGGGSNAGHVRVYDLTGGAWVQVGADSDGEAADDESGHSVSLSADGTYIAIGTPGNDGGGTNAGHVRVYTLTAGGAWTQVGADIDGASTGMDGDESGWSVSLSSDGSRVAIGATENDYSETGPGHVRVYDLTGGAWVQVGGDINGEAVDDRSGNSVSLSSDGSRVAIGAYLNDGAGDNAGHVRVYDLTGGAWVQVGADIDGEDADDESGWSVSLSSDGSRVAIGATDNAGTGLTSSTDDMGHVRVYHLTGGAWVQVGADIDGEAADDESGHSVSLSSDGSRVAIGAMEVTRIPGADDGAGHVRVYEISGGGGITSAPRSLDVWKKTSKTARLLWKTPRKLHGGTITDYIIQYRVRGASEWSTFNDGIGRRTDETVTGLTTKTRYQFQVAASTAAGVSPYSTIAGGTTRSLKHEPALLWGPLPLYQ